MIHPWPPQLFSLSSLSAQRSFTCTRCSERGLGSSSPFALVARVSRAPSRVNTSSDAPRSGSHGLCRPSGVCVTRQWRVDDRPFRPPESVSPRRAVPALGVRLHGARPNRAACRRRQPPNDPAHVDDENLRLRRRRVVHHARSG